MQLFHKWFPSLQDSLCNYELLIISQSLNFFEYIKVEKQCPCLALSHALILSGWSKWQREEKLDKIVWVNLNFSPLYKNIKMFHCNSFEKLHSNHNFNQKFPLKLKI